MPKIEEVVDRIRELETLRRDTAEFLNDEEIDSLVSGVMAEKEFIKDVGSIELDSFRVSGVDGGLIKKEYAGIDVVLSRAVAALFEFEDGKLENTENIPENLMLPDVQYIESPLDRRSFNLSSSFIRLHKEISIAIEALERDPDMVLLDGSIIPQYSERPDKGTEARKLYDDLIEKYEELFEKVLDKGILLAGVIEDSRSKRFCEEIADQDFISGEKERVLRNTRDTNMLEYLMDRGERTGVMKYAKEYEKHVVLNDIGDKAKRVRNFYLKTVSDASPVRIDFLETDSTEVTADTISERLLPLCSYSSTYGIPSVLVEADRRAKLSGDDLERFESRLSVLGPLPGIKSLRRNNRPF